MKDKTKDTLGFWIPAGGMAGWILGIILKATNIIGANTLFIIIGIGIILGTVLALIMVKAKGG